MTKFLAAELWPRIRALAARRRGRAFVAVPFIGRSAPQQISLRRGDLLVTKFDERSVRQGVVSPHAVMEFIRRGVEVHTVANLHAKVLVFSRYAIVGSANLSTLSEKFLIEAGCELREPTLVRRCREFVMSLANERVGLEYARRLLPLYRPPRLPYHPLKRDLRHATPKRGVALHSCITVVRLQLSAYDETDEMAARRARAVARRALADPAKFKLDEFWWSGRLPAGMQRFERVLMCVQERGRVYVSPPARILELKPYTSRRGAARTMVVVEVPKRVRRKQYSDVLRNAPEARVLRRIRNARRLSDPALIHELGQMWRSSASRGAA